MSLTKQKNQDKGHVVAIFDFDGTLTKKSTTLPFLRFVFPGQFILLMPFLFPALILFSCRLITIDSLNLFICWLFFKNKSRNVILSWGDLFAQTQIPHLLKDEAINALKKHQKNGHYCILATSAYDVYIKAWAEFYGFDAVVCTVFEVGNNNQFTGYLSGASCYGLEKAKKVQPWITKNTEIYAYGDSSGDKEILALADHPFYRCF
ncbi:HAD-IB family hydrolase [Legionella maioricensis]|uniref:HAD-IB family hydrolase n=1 Tax=Legionella maioricensis TaxID=2896528 RepID=A0A9X2I9I3_9GAMM|nr:HAD-IB family hydrolase [Legionella maioricensis]MCL9683045.1 HAD-IB family hydrolase [Legionella maioricensis]MCL9686393.1 HAD-IB family hydrolase [Legionella maioricensis]